MNHWLLFLVSFSFLHLTLAQKPDEVSIRKMMETADENNLVMEASSLLQENYFYLSEIITDKLLEIKPNSANYNYRKGYILLESHHDWKKALPFLLKAENQTDKYYDMYSAGEMSAPIDVLFHIAKAYQYDEQIDKAESYFNRFIENSTKKSPLNKLAKVSLTQIANYRSEKQKPIGSTVTNLGKVVNSGNEEFAPISAIEGACLWFTSNRPWPEGESEFYRDEYHNQLPEDVYKTFYSNGVLSNPSLLAFNKDSKNEVALSIGLNEDKMLLSTGTTINKDISILNSSSDSSSFPMALEVKGLNTEFWEKQLTANLNGDYYIFVSNREGGLGNLDLYEMRLNKGGEWSVPRNLGSLINSEFDEEFPYLSADGRYLYFSSNGNKSVGGFDLFVSERQEDGTWGQAVNLGLPINSSADDLGFSSTANAERGYFASRRNGGFGNLDLYQVDLKDRFPTKGAVLQVRIIGFKNQVIPSSMVLSLSDSNNNMKEITDKRMRDQNYVSTLPYCQSSTLELKMDKASPSIYKEIVKSTCEQEFEIIQKDILIDVKNNRVYTPIKYTFTAKILDKKSGSPITNASVRFKGAVTDQKWVIMKSDQNGMASFSLPDSCYIGDPLKFGVEIEHDGYLITKDSVNLTLTETAELGAEYKLLVKENGKDIAGQLGMNPIYYDYSKATLRVESIKELDKIIKLLNDNPEQQMELQSHTDCRANDVFNLALSNLRAQSALNYIQARITNPLRVTAKGYGETKPIASCGCNEKDRKCTEKEHQLNRRTEFILID